MIPTEETMVKPGRVVVLLDGAANPISFKLINELQSKKTFRTKRDCTFASTTQIKSITVERARAVSVSF